MKTNDVVMFALGLVAGYFLKNQWNKRNALASADNAGVDSLPADTNYVFSQKYKDCEKKVEEELASTAFKVTANFDMNAFKKHSIDRCMNGGAM